MNTSETMIQDYDAVLDARYGKVGTPERVKFEEEAYAYYTGLILRDARKDAKVSQAELARRTQTTKSYISRIENGVIIPRVAVFYIRQKDIDPTVAKSATVEIWIRFCRFTENIYFCGVKGISRKG